MVQAHALVNSSRPSFTSLLRPASSSPLLPKWQRTKQTLGLVANLKKPCHGAWRNSGCVLIVHQPLNEIAKLHSITRNVRGQYTAETYKLLPRRLGAADSINIPRIKTTLPSPAGLTHAMGKPCYDTLTSAVAPHFPSYTLYALLQQSARMSPATALP